METLFTGPSHVDIQGKRVLLFKDVNQEYAEYSLIGYEDYPVKIFDYRDFGLQAIDSLLKTNKLDDFAPRFNHPANTTVMKSDQGEIRIELRKTDKKNPPNMLWIAIGIKETKIPAYNFILKFLEPFKKQTALLSLYCRPYPDEFPLHYSPPNP